ncbi:Oligomycin sensitivity conferral protein [Platysternon megacephalum]|uniref:Oligomycin sensitivity conferral protein n=1 Tax=Platysternon megacephalum TaxID=55544 RepID=A0A4D9DG05_9SAUR|nr:Oligomycin sensitivity conferral protein [Platysternon megacephalum]
MLGQRSGECGELSRECPGAISCTQTRREEVVRLHQELIDCIELNFDATSELIGVLNTHLQCELHPTVRENCDIFLAAMKSIQDMQQAIDGRANWSKLEPDLYRKLHDFQETDATKMQILHSVATAVSGLTGTVAMGIFVKLALSKVVTRVQSQIMMIMVKVGASMIGAVAGMLLGVSVDLILSAFLGAVERPTGDSDSGARGAGEQVQASLQGV